MPTEQILALLIAERDKLNRAIEVLQGPTKRRGRPPRNPLVEAATGSHPGAREEKASPVHNMRKGRPRRRECARDGLLRRRLSWWPQSKTASKPKKAGNSCL